MRNFKNIGAWILAVAALTLAGPDSVHFKADATDDLSFTYTNAQAADAINLMSIDSVKKILADRLDLFPMSRIPKLAKHVMNLCRKYSVDPAFVLSLIDVESSFRTKVVSPVGAIGLMQLMPATAEHIADKFGIRYAGAKSLFDPFTNLTLGVAYLSVLRAKYQGYSPYFHIAAYNIGPAKLDELMAQKDFKPVNTKRYYDKIRLGVPRLRFYRGNAKAKRQSPPI